MTVHDKNFDLPEINTWRLYNKSITQQRVVEMVESWESHGFRFGSVCIDDGWTTEGRLGDWEPDPKRFPDLRELTDWIHAKGYGVRLWVAPAQMHAGTKIHQQAAGKALLLNKAGKPALYAGLGTYRLDPRTALGKSHIQSTMQRLVRDYQVDAFKVDFPPFYEVGDEFYIVADYDLTESDARSMIPEFYRLVHDSASEINPHVRICGAKNLSGCEPYFDDIICGDLVGESRSLESIGEICKTMRNYAVGHSMVPWLEMVWGEGSDAPLRMQAWWAGCVEFIANSINFELKIEHSFLPFDYPNIDQIRGLTNLYGPRNTCYKVLVAGRHSFTVEGLQKAGVAFTPETRFLLAPETDQTVTLHTGRLGTSALQWHCRNVMTGELIALRGRNEFWGSTIDCCFVQFEVEMYQLYELWHEGEPVDFYRQEFERASGRKR